MEFASESVGLKVTEEELLVPGHGMCPGCGEALAVRQILKVLGKKTIILLPPGCVAPATTKEDAFKFRVPAVHIGLVHGAAVAAGVWAGLEKKGVNDVIVAPIMGDGGTADIGLQALSAAAERNDNILYICLDNEAYMNTGGQGSASTPLGASTTTTPAGPIAPLGKDRPKKDLFKIITDHNVPYAATACPSFMADFRRKLEKSMRTQGFRYLHILCPCPTGWEHPSDKTVEIGRLAVGTGMFILAESEHGQIKLTYRIEKRIPIRQYLAMQGRFRHLGEDDLRVVQEHVDRHLLQYQKLAGEQVG